MFTYTSPSPKHVIRFLLLSLTAFPSFLMGQQLSPPNITHPSVEQNYVRTIQALKPGITPGTSDKMDVQISTTYVDGIGRAIQVVNREGSPLGKDEVQIMHYDTYGRQSFEFLPYVWPSTNGELKLLPSNDLVGFYQSQTDVAHSNFPFGYMEYEASPLNRVTGLAAPGESWAGSYDTQTGTGNLVRMNEYADMSESIRILEPVGNGGFDNQEGVYDPMELWVKEVRDEHGNLSRQYIDKRGQIVLKEVQEDAQGNSFLQTYYVYDSFGHLLVVLPPLAVETLENNNWNNIGVSQVSELIFWYEYDEHSRMITKKVPGAGVVYMVYDALDRLVLSQDANQRVGASQDWKWTFTLYDRLSRPVATGLFTNSQSRQQLQNEIDLPGGLAYQDVNFSLSDDRMDHRILPDNLGFEDDQVNQLKQYLARQSMVLGPDLEFDLAAGSQEGIYFGIDPNISNSSGTESLEVSVFPANYANMEFLGFTYYDDYSFDTEQKFAFDGGHAIQLSGLCSECIQSPSSHLTSPKGQVTGTKVKILGENGEDTRWLSTVTYYDDRYRVLQTHSENHLGGVDILSMGYRNEILAWVEATLLSHRNPADLGHPEITVYEDTDYDHRGRVLKITQTVNDLSPETLAEYEYNEIGEMITKKVAPDDLGNPLQTENFQYNIRGWLTHINSPDAIDPNTSDDLFGMELIYDQDFNRLGDLGRANFNGNITGIRWKSQNDQVERSYTYEYDPLNRLLRADYNSENTYEDFDVGGFGPNNTIQYDANGNIMSMARQGFLSWSDPLSDPPGQIAKYGSIDQLHYSYAGNQLIGVDDDLDDPIMASFSGQAGDFSDVPVDGTVPSKFDAPLGDEYRYDFNGNMTHDHNKGIAVEYNHLNLPVKITFVESNAKSIEYTYDAAGLKLQKRVYEANQLIGKTDYLGGFVYNSDVLEFMHTAEGRLLAPSQTASGEFEYEYQYKDHLGNLRLSYRRPGEPWTHKATMELQNSIEERREFLNIEKTRDSDWSYGTGMFSAKLNAQAGTDKPLGPLKEFAVGAGDVVKAKVWAHYVDDASENNPPFDLQAFVQNNVGTYSQEPDGFGLSQAEQRNILERLSLGIRADISNLNPPSGNGGVPVAYLRVIVYDADHKHIGEYIEQIGSTAKGGEEELVLQDVPSGMPEGIKIEQQGYVQLFVANESEVDVWFDELEIIHEPALIVQENHYYPFGMNIVGIEKQGQPDHKFQYNGKEKQSEFNLNWLDYGARNYDAALGRWHGVDPMSEIDKNLTPYRYGFNNPVNFIDVEGNFELDPKLVKKYPRLANYLQQGIQKAANEPGIVNALMKYGQLSKSDIIDDLKWGQGPIINVLPISGAYGQFSPGKGSKTIEIDETLVKLLEGASAADLNEILFLLGATILHEYTHYGDDQDGIDYPGEEGNLFEIAAYGKVVTSQNAGSLINAWIKKQIIIQQQNKQNQKNEKNEKENKARTDGFVNLINNFSELKEGKYIWNGSTWVVEEEKKKKKKKKKTDNE